MPARILVLPPMLEAMDAWQDDPSAANRAALGAEIVRVAELLGLGVGRLRMKAPPLPDLDLELGAGTAGAEIALRAPGDARPIGSARISGDQDQARAMASALELGFTAARSRARAERATRQLTALDQAVRGISGVLDLDRVLQLITDRVRDLVSAQYAAIGIVNRDGTIERFITSGISDEDRARIGDLPRGRGLLGLIIRENRTYRIPDISTHPERYGFPPHHPAMHSFLGMPITVSGAVVGRLYLTNKHEAAEFSEDDQALVEMFALHAGIAIENARLHDQVRRLAIVDERDRISRDLHDSVIQAIYAQTLALDDVPEMIGEEPGEAARRVDEAIDALHGVIRDIRNFIFGLRPVLLETGSLTDGLRHLATELHRNGGVEVAVSISDEEGEAEGLPIEVVAELLAVTREALSNIARHASATHASVELRASPDEVRLELSDDGRGFDAAREAERGHHGLTNMRGRVTALGARFDVRSQPDSGTRIIISLPRRAAGAEGMVR
ncbi:MAG: GAF domain-containing sensor histidine kinase [Candidatus Limnocylindria bacterium]